MIFKNHIRTYNSDEVIKFIFFKVNNTFGDNLFYDIVRKNLKKDIIENMKIEENIFNNISEEQLEKIPNNIKENIKNSFLKLTSNSFENNSVELIDIKNLLRIFLFDKIKK